MARWLLLSVVLLFVSVMVGVAHATSTMGPCDELFTSSSASPATSKATPLPVSFFYARGKIMSKQGGVEKVFLFPLADTSFYFAYTRQSKRLLFFNDKSNQCKQVTKVLCYQNELNCADFELSDGKKIHMCFKESVYDPSLWPEISGLFENLFDLLKSVPLNNLQGVFRESASTADAIKDKANQAILYRGRESAWTHDISIVRSPAPDQHRQALDVAQLISALVKRLPPLIDDEEVNGPDRKTAPWFDMDLMSKISGQMTAIAGPKAQQYEFVKTALTAMEDDDREEAEAKIACLLSPFVDKIEQLAAEGTEQQKAKLALFNVLVKGLYGLLGDDARNRFIAEHPEAKIEKVVAPSTVLNFWLTSLISSSRLLIGDHPVSEQQKVALQFYRKRPQNMCSRFPADKKKIITCGPTCQTYQALSWSLVWAGALDLYAQRMLSRDVSLPTCNPDVRLKIEDEVTEEEEVEQEEREDVPPPTVLSLKQKDALRELGLSILVPEKQQQSETGQATTEDGGEVEAEEEEEEEEEDELVWTQNPIEYTPFEDDDRSLSLSLSLSSSRDDFDTASLSDSGRAPLLPEDDETPTTSPTSNLRGAATLDDPLFEPETTTPRPRLSIDPSLEVFDDAPSVSQRKLQLFESQKPVQPRGSRIFNFDLQISPISTRIRFFQDLLKPADSE